MDKTNGTATDNSQENGVTSENSQNKENGVTSEKSQTISLEEFESLKKSNQEAQKLLKEYKKKDDDMENLKKQSELKDLEAK